MIFTFYRAMGLSVGSSMVEEDLIPLAKELMDKAKAKGVNFYLPTDVVVADKVLLLLSAVHLDDVAKEALLLAWWVALLLFVAVVSYRCWCCCYCGSNEKGRREFVVRQST